MIYVAIIAAVLATAALAVGVYRLWRRPDLSVTPEVVRAAELRAGAIVELREAEAKAKAGTLASAARLDAAERRGRKSGLGSVLEGLGAKRK